MKGSTKRQHDLDRRKEQDVEEKRKQGRHLVCQIYLCVKNYTPRYLYAEIEKMELAESCKWSFG